MTDENRCEPPPEWRFRKKPVVIEAFQLGVKWPEWWHEKHITNEVTTHNADGRHRGGPDYALIHTLEGVMRAEKGDWIIRGVRGEIYPCKPDIFALTYEAVSDLAPVTPPATVAALVEALEAFSVAIPAVLDAADIDASDTVFRVRAVSPTGSRELAQRSLADMLEAARAALALYREAGR